MTAIGPAQSAVQAAAALAGAALASGSHLAKAGTRIAANTSPEPFSNRIMSLSEDGLVVVLGLLALKYPLAAAAIVIVGVGLIVASTRWLWRRVRRRARRA